MKKGIAYTLFAIGFLGFIAMEVIAWGSEAPPASNPPVAPSSAPITAPTEKSNPVLPTSPSPASIPGLNRSAEMDADGQSMIFYHVNADGLAAATYDPRDRVHNNHIAWHWEGMSSMEKELALRWMFDPNQMSYVNFQSKETWVISSLTKWIPRIKEFGAPSEPRVASHWQTDGPPLSETTLYEALSRIKTLALIPERRICNFGFSDRGLVEYGGETILFTAPGWQRITVKSREIFTVIWTIKEAMVLYYPQTLGWENACPSEETHLKNEYYSMIWLLAMEQTLSEFVPADNSYWHDQEIPFQIRNITTSTFPLCQSPASLGAVPRLSATPCHTLP